MNKTRTHNYKITTIKILVGTQDDRADDISKLKWIRYLYKRIMIQTWYDKLK